MSQDEEYYPSASQQEEEGGNDDEGDKRNVGDDDHDDDDDDDNDDDNDDNDDDNDVVDEDTLRIMISTDNHLGYAERDPIRGLDSFAAFEEMLWLAKKHKCDMVLLAGDLFHDNKPSRCTLHKTVGIIRKYCMGPRPVQFQIVSDQAKNFRGPMGTVNYEDEYFSVDLPIFSIHGNHDDPTRDGGTELLAALDLLAVTNLVNYFGRQDEVDNVTVSPVLMRKGRTNVALYGMGSMRDERLNRMWQGKKVRFLQPEATGEGGENDDDEGEGNNSKAWFNIFALHQNRDLGRGTKNCVHESMIPEWMDLVIWGHEHECRIMPDESKMGTFRICQPGSSVATSLTVGESEKKHVGILDIRQQSFRLRPEPLTKVRAFATGEICLNNIAADVGLDAEDPEIDNTMAGVLKDHVQKLIEEARNSTGAAEREVEPGTDGLGYALIEPKNVLVRLKVEHTGFGTLNNQKFGSDFVREVANPSDILLFHRVRQSESSGRGRTSNRSGMSAPIDPVELEQINVEDLIRENLEAAEKKMQVLNENRLSNALDNFVSKEQGDAIVKVVENELERSQKELIDRNREDDGEGGRSKITTGAAVREVLTAMADRQRDADADEEEEEEDDDDDNVDVDEVRSDTRRRRGGKRSARSTEDDGDSSDGEAIDSAQRSSAKRAKTTVATKSSGPPMPSKGAGRSAAKSRRSDPDDPSEDSDAKITAAAAAAAPSSSSRPQRKVAAASRARGGYKDVDSDVMNDDGDDDGNFVAPDNEDDEELSDVDEVEVSPRPKEKNERVRGTTARSVRKKQTTIGRGSFTPARKTRADGRGASSAFARRRNAPVDSSDDNSDKNGGIVSQGTRWGTANGKGTQSSLRARRR